MVQKSTTLFSEYYFRVLNLPAACFALCAGRGPSGGTERKQPAERKSGRSSGAEHGGSQKTRWRLPAAFCSNLLAAPGSAALLQNKKTSGPAAGGFSASNCIKYCSSSGDISARSFCKNSSAACWVMLAILIYTCADISSTGKFLYSVADVTSIRNIFRDTSALVLPASLCALVGLKEVNTGARMRWYSTVAHNCHGKIIFNRGKIIFNQGKYILYTRDLCSSYKMGLELPLHVFVRRALSRSFDQFYFLCFCSGFSLEDF